MGIVTMPTVGRKVWYFHSAEHAHGHEAGTAKLQPLDATVLFVHDERTVNLLVSGHQGEQEFVPSVHLRQDGEDMPVGAHASWMPYQVKQAEKAVAMTMAVLEITPPSGVDSAGDKL